MAQFSRGITFQDNTTGHVSAELHQLIEAAHILPAAITDQPAAVPQGGDRFIFVQAANNTLKSVTHAQLLNSLPHDAPANVASLRKLGVAALQACAGNDTRLRNPLSGVRVGQGTGIDREAEPDDYRFVSLLIPATHIIDWNASEIFYDDLSANRTYTFVNVRDGRTIQAVFKKNGHTVTLPGAIGTVVVGTGTTFLHVILTKSALGITGLQIQI